MAFDDLFGKLKRALSPEPQGEQPPAPRPGAKRASGLEQVTARPQNLTGGRRTLSPGELIDLQRDAQVRTLDEEAKTLLAELRGKLPPPAIPALRAVPRALEEKSWNGLKTKLPAIPAAEWAVLERALPQLDRGVVDVLAELPAFDAASVEPALSKLGPKERAGFAEAVPVLGRLDAATRRAILRTPQVPVAAGLDAAIKAWPKVPADVLRKAAAVMAQLPKATVDAGLSAPAAKPR